MSNHSGQSSTPAMKPTTIEHDFRFPRRPDAGSSTAGDLRTNAMHLQAGLTKSYAAAVDELLGPSLLSAHLSPATDFNTSTITPGVEQNYPLPDQAWKLFGQAPHNHPARQRMENIAWRLMAPQEPGRGPQPDVSQYVL